MWRAANPAPIRDARYHVVRAATEFEGYQIDRRSAIGKYILAGEHLLEARKVAKHGEWGPLLDEFGLTPPTAWRMMRLAESGLTADAVIELGGIREATKSFTVKDLEPVAPTHNVDVDLGPNMSTAEPHRIPRTDGGRP